METLPEDGIRKPELRDRDNSLKLAYSEGQGPTFHCEEQSDEAISSWDYGVCYEIATPAFGRLAMTMTRKSEIIEKLYATC